MVAVRLHDNLYTGSGYIRQELTHQRLTSRMQVDFRILDKKDVFFSCRKRSDDNR